MVTRMQYALNSVCVYTTTKIISSERKGKHSVYE